MSDSEHPSVLDRIALVKSFYQAHEMAFARAAQAEKSEDRHFAFSGEQFDDWAVAAGYMPKVARKAEGLEAHGLTRRRTELRYRLNRFARRSNDVPRAYSVEARGGRWRVVLQERFLEEQPHEIVAALWRTYEGAEGKIERLKKHVDIAKHLDETERGLAMNKLEGAETSIMFGISQLQIVAHQLHPNAPKLNLRKLRREMAELMAAALAGRPMPREMKQRGRPDKSA